MLTRLEIPVYRACRDQGLALQEAGWLSGVVSLNQSARKAADAADVAGHRTEFELGQRTADKHTRCPFAVLVDNRPAA